MRDIITDLNQKGSVIFGSNYDRIKELKRKYDPENVFSKSHVQMWRWGRLLRNETGDLSFRKKYSHFMMIYVVVYEEHVSFRSNQYIWFTRKYLYF